MTSLLEFRKKVIEWYGRYEYILTPLAKFVLALCLLMTVNSHIGFNEMLTNPLLDVILALLCALVPVNFIAAILIVVVLIQLYALSLEAMLVGGVLFLLMLLLYFRFSPRDTALILLLPLASLVNLQYAVPVAAGLLFGPGAAVGVAFGVVIIQYLSYIEQNAAVLSNGTVNEATLDNFRTLVDALMQNRAMWIAAVAFAAAALVVYYIRRLETAHSWTIAIAAGNVVEIFILLLGDMEYDTNLSLGGLFLGIVLSVLIELVIEFFCFMVDYTRIETVQFEDDDYYYYVKAVPKVTVSKSVRTVKTISISGGGGERPAVSREADTSDPFEDQAEDEQQLQ